MWYIVAENDATSQSQIPSYLIREIIKGKPLYYKGYKKVLNKETTFEDIAYSSSLQSLLAAYVIMLCARQKLHDRYEILAGVPGLAIDSNNHLVCSLLLFDPAILTPAKISTRYADVPPKLALLIDDKVEVAIGLHASYVRNKVDVLLGFGAEKVIWIFTDTQQVMIFTKNQPPLTFNWNEDVELIDGITFNIGQYIKNKSV